MGRFRISVFLCGLLAFAGPANGQVAKSTPPKLVTIAFNASVMQTAEAKLEFGALQTKFAPRQTKLETLNSEVERLRKELTDSSAKLTDADRGTREQALSGKEKQLQRESEDFQNDTQEASQQAFQKIAQKMYVFLQEYCKEHAYDMVIERGTDAAPVVWYAVERVDITGDVAKAYDAKGAVGSSNTLPSAPPMPSAR